MKYWVVDAFRGENALGNPAAVCLIDKFPTTEAMQDVAALLDLSETTFVVPLAENKYYIRWFSPKDEAPLCGHATMAAIKILQTENLLKNNTFQFQYNSGTIDVTVDGDLIAFSFPRLEIELVEDANQLATIQAVIPGVEIESLYKDKVLYIAVLKSPDQLKALTPDLSALLKINCRALCVTSHSNDGFDFQSRYFAPRVGIDEDPVCGSAHSRLGPYWSRRLSKTNLFAYQASSRAGHLQLTVTDTTLTIAGRAEITSESIMPDHVLELLL